MRLDFLMDLDKENLIFFDVADAEDHKLAFIRISACDLEWRGTPKELFMMIKDKMKES